MRRVVITGMGTVNPIGNSVEELKESLRNGTSGVGKITHFDTEGFKATLACEVKFDELDDLIGKKEARRMDRFTKLAVAACEEAVKDANLMNAYDPFDVSIYMTSGIGGLTTMEENVKKYM